MLIVPAPPLAPSMKLLSNLFVYIPELSLTVTSLLPYNIELYIGMYLKLNKIFGKSWIMRCKQIIIFFNVYR